MIISFDMRCFLTSRGRGIGNYTVGLVNTMISEHPENTYIFLNWTDEPAECYFDIGESTNTVDYRCQGAYDADTVKCVIEDFVKRYSADVFWTTIPVVKGYPTYKKEWFKNTFLVATVHDLIEYIFKDYYFSCFEAYKSYLTNLYQIKEYDLVFTNSENTKNDVIRYLDMPRSKVQNIYMDGCECKNDDNNNENGTQDLCGRLRNTDFLLCLSGPLANKNARRLVKAFSIIKKDIGDTKLVITGVTGITDSAIKRIACAYGCPDDVVSLGRVSNTELDWLYAHSGWLVLPSIYEGFGMPVLEAWKYGVPVIASNNSSVGEIVQNAGILFDPFNVDSIKDALKKAVSLSDKERNLYIEAGRIRSGDFSWSKTSDKAMSYLNELLVRGSHDVSSSEIEESIRSDLESNINIWGSGEEIKTGNDEVYRLWDETDNKGEKLICTLKKLKCEKVAIYGLGFWGDRILNKLVEHDFKVDYIIDRMADYLVDYVPVIKPEGHLEETDMIIVTPWEKSESIIKEMKTVTSIPLIPLDGLILDSFR